MSARDWSSMVAIGRVVKPQGRHGEVAVDPMTDSPTRFAELRETFVAAPDGGARKLRVTSCWPHQGRFVLKLEGVDSIDQAERYRGLELRIGEEELPALPEGSYYHHQLVGLRVAQESGEGGDLGVVEAILETGATPVLVVRGGGVETLVPLAEDFVRSVDLVAKRLVVRRLEAVRP